MKREVQLPGAPHLKLTVYGVDKARGLQEDMAQAFYVERDGVPTPRCDLTQAENAALLAYLVEHHPQHSRLITG